MNCVVSHGYPHYLVGELYRFIAQRSRHWPFSQCGEFDEHIVGCLSSPKVPGPAMKTNSISKQGFNLSLRGNVACKFQVVKRAARNFFKNALSASVISGLAFSLSTAAHAEDANVKAITNSTQLLNLVSGVVPSGLPRVLESIHTGVVKRIAPSYPVWVLESEQHSILYYQGQPTFAGQNATRLVDDKGLRFGLQALENAGKSRSTWLRLTLSGVEYRAYCASKAPFVVCTLIAS